VSKPNQNRVQTIGQYMGRVIVKTITNQNGTYEFNRIAQCTDEGCPLDQLNDNEVLLTPGLIYRHK
jgi:hypothetical protein